MTITLILIIITAIVSIAAFQNDKLYNDLIFYPPAVTFQKQWYRFFTCGLIHADFGHLIFNMYALYVFGIGTTENPGVEAQFVGIFQEKGKIIYLLMYVSTLFFCLLPTYSQNKENASYRSLGASGAVSAVIFSFIILQPLSGIGILFIPFFIPGFLFGFLYLIISTYLDKKGGGNINHSAHTWGALYGIAFLIITSYLLSDYKVLTEFIDKIKMYINNF